MASANSILENKKGSRVISCCLYYKFIYADQEHRVQVYSVQVSVVEAVLVCHGLVVLEVQAFYNSAAEAVSDDADQVQERADGSFRVSAEAVPVFCNSAAEAVPDVADQVQEQADGPFRVSAEAEAPVCHGLVAVEQAFYPDPKHRLLGESKSCS